MLREVIMEGNGEFWGWGEDGVLKGGNKGREWRVQGFGRGWSVKGR